MQLLPGLYAFKSQSAHLKERRREVFIKGLMSSKPSEEAPQALSRKKYTFTRTNEKVKADINI